ncbi:MAG TPA: DUF1702 family protein, partial [Flavisolibacter sp.]
MAWGIFKRILYVSDKETSFAKRGFCRDNVMAAAQLEKIGSFFLKGYRAALSTAMGEPLTRLLNNTSVFYKGFSYEGAAMALLIQDWFGILKKKRLNQFMEQEEGAKHIYMLHVGAGWGYARLPVNLEKKIERYDPLLRWLVVDGYGFHQGYFKTKKYVERMQPPRLRSIYAMKAFYQGLGRCLWFVDGAVPDRIARRIAGFPPEYQPELWSGVGLACTYAVGVSESDLWKLKELSLNAYPYLAQGAVFAAKARERAEIITSENETACQVICSMTVRQAAGIA